MYFTKIVLEFLSLLLLFFIGAATFAAGFNAYSYLQ